MKVLERVDLSSSYAMCRHDSTCLGRCCRPPSVGEVCSLDKCTFGCEAATSAAFSIAMLTMHAHLAVGSIASVLPL